MQQEDMNLCRVEDYIGQFISSLLSFYWVRLKSGRQSFSHAINCDLGGFFLIISVFQRMFEGTSPKK